MTEEQKMEVLERLIRFIVNFDSSLIDRCIKDRNFFTDEERDFIWEIRL